MNILANGTATDTLFAVAGPIVTLVTRFAADRTLTAIPFVNIPPNTSAVSTLLTISIPIVTFVTRFATSGTYTTDPSMCILPDRTTSMASLTILVPIVPLVARPTTLRTLAASPTPVVLLITCFAAGQAFATNPLMRPDEAKYLHEHYDLPMLASESGRLFTSRNFNAEILTKLTTSIVNIAADNMILGMCARKREIFLIGFMGRNPFIFGYYG